MNMCISNIYINFISVATRGWGYTAINKSLCMNFWMQCNIICRTVYADHLLGQENSIFWFRGWKYYTGTFHMTLKFCWQPKMPHLLELVADRSIMMTVIELMLSLCPYFITIIGGLLYDSYIDLVVARYPS